MSRLGYFVYEKETARPQKGQVTPPASGRLQTSQDQHNPGPGQSQFLKLITEKILN